MMGRHLGLTANTGKTAGSAVATGLLTAAAVDPEPISKTILAAVGGLASLFTSLFGFGYDANKLNDTAVTEGVQVALHQMWFNLTGEDLGGVNPTCTPGQCGSQHVNIFGVSTNYPNVPSGPAGYSQYDVNQIISAAQSLIAQGRSKLIRPQSDSGYDANSSYMMGLFNQVAQARTAANPISTLFSSVSGSGIGTLLPWLLGGLAVYQFVL